MPTDKPPMTPEQHRERHAQLHGALDELMADFQRHTGRLLSLTSIVDLATWSHAQTIEPTHYKHDDRFNAPEYFESGPDYACFRPVATLVNFSRVTELCSGAIAFARQMNFTRLLVDTTGLNGFGVPSALDRFEFAQRCASAPQGKIKVVFLALQEMIDPNRFGLDVAMNRGFYTAVFASEADAVAWLMDQRT